MLAGRLALAELRARGHAHGIFAALAGGLSFAELFSQVTLPVQLSASFEIRSSRRAWCGAELVAFILASPNNCVFSCAERAALLSAL